MSYLISIKGMIIKLLKRTSWMTRSLVFLRIYEKLFYNRLNIRKRELLFWRKARSEMIMGSGWLTTSQIDITSIYNFYLHYYIWLLFPWFYYNCMALLKKPCFFKITVKPTQLINQQMHYNLHHLDSKLYSHMQSVQNLHVRRLVADMKWLGFSKSINNSNF